MNVYYRGGHISQANRIARWEEVSIEDAPKEMIIYPFKFKLYHVKSIDGGLLYDCINEDIEYCESCFGNGKQSCQKCDGSGEVECENCSGAGWSEKEEDKKSKQKKQLSDDNFKKNQILLEL